MVKFFCSVPILFLLSGCHNQIKPPSIKVLAKVEQVAVEVDKGCVCGSDAQNTFRLIQQLRQSESYYIEQITNYNEQFTD